MKTLKVETNIYAGTGRLSSAKTEWRVTDLLLEINFGGSCH